MFTSLTTVSRPHSASATIFMVVTMLCITVTARTADSSSPLPLKIRFWADEIELTGAMPDERGADRLRIAVYNAQFGKAVWDRLVIDPGRAIIEMPRLDDLAGLLLELSLSTVDGGLEIASERIIVTGLTDSQVTHAAIEARLRMLGTRPGGRPVWNRVCIVTEEDLALPQPRRPRPVLNPPSLGIAPFVLADDEYGPTPPPLLAIPVAATTAPGESAIQIMEAAADEFPGHEALAPIQFAVNTYIVRYDQFTQIDAAVRKLRSLPESAGKIVLRGYPDQSGSHDYNDWLGQSRAHAVRRQLLDSGVPEERFAVETPQTTANGTHLGTVLILIPQTPGETPHPADDGLEPQAGAASHAPPIMVPGPM